MEKQYFLEQLEHNIKQIQNMLNEEKKDYKSISASFFNILEMKARLERLEENITNLSYHSCLRDLEKHLPDMINLYEQNFTYELPENIIASAKKIEENLELLSSGTKNEKVEEILKESFDIFIQRETLELVHKEIKKVDRKSVV